MLFGGIAFLLASALAEHAFHLNRTPQGTRQSHADEQDRRQLKYVCRTEICGTSAKNALHHITPEPDRRHSTRTTPMARKPIAEPWPTISKLWPKQKEIQG
jgi:hypothetical protein